MKSAHGVSSFTNPRLKQRRKEKRLSRVCSNSKTSKDEGVWKNLKQIIQHMVQLSKISSMKIFKK